MAETETAALTLRYMTLSDLSAVMVVERSSFTAPWPADSYVFEVRDSTCSYMLVLEIQQPQPVQGLRRVWANLVGNEPETEMQRLVIGHGGMWKIQEEGHISTIATHPNFRGRGYGEVMLAGMVRRAVTMGAEYMVLEVRVSNTVAQKLYIKYGFQIQGVKANYYRDDLEDAYDMRLDLTRPDAVAHVEALYQNLQNRLPFIDRYSNHPHPRLG